MGRGRLSDECEALTPSHPMVQQARSQAVWGDIVDLTGHICLCEHDRCNSASMILTLHCSIVLVIIVCVLMIW